MNPPALNISSAVAVCTLADGDYFTGVGALANSLHASGFRGTLWVGYRGALPDWAARAVERGVHRALVLPDGFTVCFVTVPHGDTLALEKPDFALRVLDELAPDSEAVVFFDADVVVLAPWARYLEWLEAGVGLCTDIQPFKHASHPHRRAWRQMIGAIGRSARDQDCYFNSGFIAVARQHRDMLVCWSQLIGEYRRRVGQAVPGIRHGEQLTPLWATDQEMLNAAAMASEAPLSIVGPEGMDFASPAYMSHAIGRKPWRARYLADALRGIRPSSVDRHFWRLIGGPIEVLPAAVVQRQRVLLNIAAAIGRFYGRW